MEGYEGEQDSYVKNSNNSLLDRTISILFIIFLITGVIVFGGVIYTVDYELITDRDLLSFVIIATSVVTGSFFITKTYINSQISIKEKEMGKEFREDIRRIAREQERNIFSKLDEKLDKKLDEKLGEQTEKIMQIINAHSDQKKG